MVRKLVEGVLRRGRHDQRVAAQEEAIRRLELRVDELSKQVKKLQTRLVSVGGVGDEQSLVVVEADCIGCGTCAELAPSVFEMRSDGKAEVLKPYVEPEKVQAAVDACPTSCITWE